MTPNGPEVGKSLLLLRASLNAPRRGLRGRVQREQRERHEPGCGGAAPQQQSRAVIRSPKSFENTLLGSKLRLNSIHITAHCDWLLTAADTPTAGRCEAQTAKNLTLKKKIVLCVHAVSIRAQRKHPVSANSPQIGP